MAWIAVALALVLALLSRWRGVFALLSCLMAIAAGALALYDGASLAQLALGATVLACALLAAGRRQGR